MAQQRCHPTDPAPDHRPRRPQSVVRDSDASPPVRAARETHRLVDERAAPHPAPGEHDPVWRLQRNEPPLGDPSTRDMDTIQAAGPWIELGTIPHPTRRLDDGWMSEGNVPDASTQPVSGSLFVTSARPGAHSSVWRQATPVHPSGDGAQPADESCQISGLKHIWRRIPDQCPPRVHVTETVAGVAGPSRPLRHWLCRPHGIRAATTGGRSPLRMSSFCCRV